MLPLCHLTVALRFSQLSRLGFVTKIYPFLSFESPLESSAKTNYPDNNRLSAPNVFSREPSHGISAPIALGCLRTSLDELCPTH
jgi:hypothetical protein